MVKDSSVQAAGASSPRAGRSTTARIGWVMCLLVAATAPVRAADVVANVQDTNGAYQVDGSFTAAAPVATVWQVLTDYEHIGAFVKSVRSSAFVDTHDDGRVLRQDAVAGPFPFRRKIRVELSIREVSRRRIEFHDVLGRDFRRYAGTWTLRHVASGTEVGYVLDAEPRVGMPALVGRGVMARSARDLLTQVRAEILRRASASRAAADRVARIN